MMKKVLASLNYAKIDMCAKEAGHKKKNRLTNHLPTYVYPVYCVYTIPMLNYINSVFLFKNRPLILI